MADIPLNEVAQITGVPYANLKKQGQRGQLRIKTVGGRLYVASEDVDAYMAVKDLDDLHPAIVGQPMGIVAREVGNMIAKMPQKVRDAVLDGLPTSKKGGSPEPYREAVAKQGGGVRGFGPASVSDDPHFGFKVGYQHEESPRWKRTSSSTWSLNGATWTYSPNPKGGDGIWIAGGTRGEGTRLAPGISPANPFSDLRPLG